MSAAESPLYLAHHYFNGIKKQIGTKNVRGFYHGDMFNEHYFKNIGTKIQHKLFPNLLFSKISKHLEQLVEEYQPDTVLIFKGMEINPNSLKRIKKKNIKLVNYNLDHPFDYFSKGSGNQNILKSLELYDLHISYSKTIIQQLKDRIPKIDTAFLPFGFNLPDELYEQEVKQEEEVQAIAFVGGGDINRANFIQKIVKTGLPVHVYGYNWENHLRPASNLQLHDSVLNMDYWKTLRKYRVQLNLFRPHNVNSHNMRSFEVPAVGGIMLAPSTTEHLSFFKKDKEAFFFDDTKEAIHLCKIILGLSHDQANKIRWRARNRSIQDGYDYRSRSKQLLEILEHRN